MLKLHAIIIGAPGSGKGTISKRIVDAFKLVHISSGDILRNNIFNKTEVGQIAEQYVSKGKLVPDDIIDEIISTELQTLEDKNWLLDGYPRKKHQCEKLSTITTIDLCINLVVPFSVIEERLQSRWIHPKSGRIYNIGFNDPKVPGLDDITGEKLVQREDDKPEAVKKRLELYNETIGPVIDYYKVLGVAQDFHGETSDHIWTNVYSYMKNLSTFSS